MLSFRLKKQASKNVADTTFKLTSKKFPIRDYIFSKLFLKQTFEIIKKILRIQQTGVMDGSNAFIYKKFPLMVIFQKLDS